MAMALAADDAEVAACGAGQIQIAWRHLAAMDGGQHRHTAEPADQAGQQMRPGQVGVKHFDARLLHDDVVHLHRRPRRVVAHRRGVDRSAGCAQPRTKAARRGLARRSEAGSSSEQPGDNNGAGSAPRSTPASSKVRIESPVVSLPLQ